MHGSFAYILWFWQVLCFWRNCFLRLDCLKLRILTRLRLSFFGVLNWFRRLDLNFIELWLKVWRLARTRWMSMNSIFNSGNRFGMHRVYDRIGLAGWFLAIISFIIFEHDATFLNILADNLLVLGIKLTEFLEEFFSLFFYLYILTHFIELIVETCDLLFLKNYTSSKIIFSRIWERKLRVFGMNVYLGKSEEVKLSWMLV